MGEGSPSIKEALLQESTLHAHVRPGTAAMKPRDIRLIAVEERALVRDSVDLDGVTRISYPNDHRWDYILSVSRDGQLVGVEPHSARR